MKELKEEEAADLRRRLEGALNNATNGKKTEDKRQVGMMVSLDHSIYFHNPRAFRADEWMLTEMESPWAGEGRGLAVQKIWSQDGTLIATCTQEVCYARTTAYIDFHADMLLGCGSTEAGQDADGQDLDLLYTPTRTNIPLEVSFTSQNHYRPFPYVHFFAVAVEDVLYLNLNLLL